MHQLVIASVPGGSNVASVVAASADIIHRPIMQYPYVLQGKFVSTFCFEYH
jgi:hypothetical protein